MFYWRAWEYFSEVIYPQKKGGVWEGIEKGDQSREYLLAFQDSWKTKVTSDEEGFRITPFRADTYPILIVGDSHTWGSGLSDEETIPWRVSELLQIPVFNGARTPFFLEHLLQKKEVKDCKIIIELVSIHLLYTPGVLPAQFTLKDPKTFVSDSLSFFKTDVRRYFLPYKLLRFFSLKNLQSFRNQKKINESMVSLEGYSIPPLIEALEKIEIRAKEIEKMGYKYLFVPIPCKGIICANQLDDVSIKNCRTLIEELEKRGVHSLDLTVPFSQVPDRKKLFLRTDTHISAFGAKIASEMIAQKLRTNFLQ